MVHFFQFRQNSCENFCRFDCLSSFTKMRHCNSSIVSSFTLNFSLTLHAWVMKSTLFFSFYFKTTFECYIEKLLSPNMLLSKSIVSIKEILRGRGYRKYSNIHALKPNFTNNDFSFCSSDHDLKTCLKLSPYVLFIYSRLGCNGIH